MCYLRSLLICYFPYPFLVWSISCCFAQMPCFGVTLQCLRKPMVKPGVCADLLVCILKPKKESEKLLFDGGFPCVEIHMIIFFHLFICLPKDIYWMFLKDLALSLWLQWLDVGLGKTWGQRDPKNVGFSVLVFFMDLIKVLLQYNEMLKMALGTKIIMGQANTMKLLQCLSSSDMTGLRILLLPILAVWL